METTEMKFRNHISIVIERFGTIFIGIVIVLGRIGTGRPERNCKAYG